MKIWDYINSTNGQRLVALYAGVLTVINVNLGFLHGWIVSAGGKFPEGWTGVIAAILAAVLGTAFVLKKDTPDGPVQG